MSEKKTKISNTMTAADLVAAFANLFAHLAFAAFAGLAAFVAWHLCLGLVYRKLVTKKIAGPDPLPVLGSAHYMHGYDIPFEAFTRLRETFGELFSIRLGSTECVVVSSVELRDEVLNVSRKADDFDARPNFERMRRLFGGDKDNGRQTIL